ncbi:hypothetical protein [Enterocloster bolteae]|uniref:hypothetical protein n=1 Tax=Enterocloster bolteae TaxID=208479 RepID=UPI0028DB0063|nr:hypothetical protein [Enterocloster bolteae]
MRIKKWVSIMLAGIMAMSINMVSFAEEGGQEDYGEVTRKELVTKYQLTEDEIIHMKENIESALAKANNGRSTIREGESTEQVIPISENLRLVISTNADTDNKNVNEKVAYRTTITGTFIIENVLGMDIVTLNSVGVFERDGRTCNPVDAYGTYDTFVWTVTDVNSRLSSAGYNAWVRNSFDGECNIGIDPISMTIFSFDYTCTINCDANGNYYTSWS